MKKNKSNLHKLHKNLTLFLLILSVTFLLSGRDNSREKQDYKNAGGEIVAIFEDKVSDQELDDLTEEYAGAVKIVKHIDDYALLSVKYSADFDEILDSLEANPKIAEVQGNTDISSLGFSNDTYADSQWAINNPGSYLYLTGASKYSKTGIEDVDMDVLEAWDTLNSMSVTKREVVVAVIDTGVDYKHPDLAQNMWVNQGEIDGDGIDNDNNGYVDDVYGWDFYNGDASVCHYLYSAKYNKYIADPEDNDDHGTHVAGIIGATYNNGVGIAGVASKIDVKIMALKINGGSKGTGSLSDAVEAVKYATMMGADICNLSWGTSQNTSSLEKVMKESDILFVAAAGNTGANNDSNPIYPADLKLDNMISVTFINAEGELTILSNYGSNSVDLAAPGEDIYSTVVGNYGIMSGSSMAAPQVSGVAALMYACNDYIYASNVKDILLRNVKPLTELQGFVRNAGIPNANQALLSSGSLSRDINPPVMSFSTIYEKGDMLVPINAVDDGSSGVRVLRWSLGTKSVSDFKRGVLGTAVENNQVSISKAGIYTFYASDFAGNEAVQTYEVKEDKTAPKMKVSYTVAEDYKSRAIALRVSDYESLVKRVEYMAGSKSAEDFLPSESGTEVVLKDGKASIQVKKDGTYTIFAIDYRGNIAISRIKVKTVKATKLKLLKTSKTMKVDDNFILTSNLFPENTTDQIIYSSLNKAVATVSKSGEIHALKPGKATIAVKTSSGLKATCVITVKAITSS